MHYTGPASGAGIQNSPLIGTIISNTPATPGTRPAFASPSGQASVTPTANGTPGGPYIVSATVNGASPPVPFSLTNTTPPHTTYTVGTTADHAAGSPAPFSECIAPGNTTCALRDAIGYATSGTDTIVFNTTGRGTITLINDASHGTLRLIASVTITGPASGAGVTVDGGCTANCAAGNAVGGVVVFAVNSGVTASIANLTITHGNGGIGVGGGIANDGTLTVTNSALTVNNGGNGGAISNGGMLILTNSTLSGNFARLGGGGLYSLGTVIASGDSLVSNTGTNGGGIFNRGTLTMTNSTLSGNSGIDSGGIRVSTGSVTLINSTLSGNSATSNSGGGIGVISGLLNLQNSIVAGNTAFTGPDIGGAVTSNGHNLIGNSTGATGLLGTDLTNVSPLLAPLNDYGGPTQTVALLPGSPAIGAGATSGVGIPTTDQRGVARTGHNDIGAFQSQGFALAVVSGTPQSAPLGGAFAPLVVSVTGNASNEPVNGGVVTFTGPATGASIQNSPLTATIGGGQVTVTPRPNATVGGPYTVSAGASGATPASVPFALTNAPAALQRITLAVPASVGSPPTLKVGQTAHFTATGHYSDGSTPDITAQVQWTSSNAAIAKVDAAGNVTGESPSTPTTVPTISATLGGMSVTMAVAVGAPVPVGIQPAPVPGGRSGAPSQPGAGQPTPAPAPAPGSR